MKPQQQTKSERLEARISREQKHLFQYAAHLQGRSLTDFAISALLDAANQAIQEYAIMQLSMQDQNTFVQAILNPPEPNKSLVKAAKRYHKEIND